MPIRKISFAAIGAIGPEYEVVGLLGHQTQVIERNRLGGHSFFDTIIQPIAVVDLQDTTVSRCTGTESIGHGTGWCFALRNRYRKRGRSCRIGYDPLVFLTCGQCHQHTGYK